MRRMLRGLLILTAVGLAGSVTVSADQSLEELEKNRELLARAKRNPDQYAKLRQNLKAFQNLPTNQQERLRRLDRELHELSSTTSNHLFRTLERYSDWLERLPETERRKVESAPNETERLRVIKQIRQGQWVERLPKAYREQIEASQGEKRIALINQFRQEERKRAQQWTVAKKHWEDMLKMPAPTRLTELQQPTVDFVERQLMQRLTKEEKDRLKAAEGNWPQFPQTLVELTDKAFQIAGPLGPRRWRDFPMDLQRRVTEKLTWMQQQELQSLEGKWPEFAIKLHELVKNKSYFPPQQFPAAPADFSQPIQRFIQNQLERALNDREKIRLKQAETKWPNYARLLVVLSQKHNLAIPTQSLPGPLGYWEKYRLPKSAGTVSSD